MGVLSLRHLDRWPVLGQYPPPGGSRIYHYSMIHQEEMEGAWGRPPVHCQGRGGRRPQTACVLERAQKDQQVLLLRRSETPEVVDDAIRFRALAVVLVDSIQQIAGPAVVQKEDALSEPP
jgi:hypothetical protein